jgi:hypothetical protein
LHEVAAILVLRALPVFAFFLVTPQTNRRQKIAVVIGAALLGVLTRSWSLLPWTWLALSYLYLLAVGSAVPLAAHALRSKRLSRPTVFAICFSSFLLVPGLFWPPSMKLAALVFGWDLVLSSYSYCVESSRSEEPLSRADCWFFLFVNPALVYSQRGSRTGPPSVDRTGLGRIVVAFLVFFSAVSVLKPLDELVTQRASGNALSGIAQADLVIAGAAAFVLQYAQASALASLQIGLLSQTGHRIPERYNWPIRAKTLPDFWRRWNTYVSQWMLLYVFWPLSFDLGRPFRDRRARALVTVAALITAFVAVGVLHDAYNLFLAPAARSRMTTLFFFNGLLVTLWLGLERLVRGVEQRFRIPNWGGALASAVSRVCLWCVVSTFAAFWWLRL